MPRSTLVTTTKSKHITTTYSFQLVQSPKEIGKTLVHQLKKINNSGIFRTCNKKDYDLDPIEEHMKSYRKGFVQRSKDSDYDFDKIIYHGFGTWNNQCDYTLRLSITPNQIRSCPAY
ncbi:hypothetical protein CONCODRAFT_9394 [Conidiobolus coronatus NRRL 28638]|uniref:Uncharacterized protein n=1 Tax=Conidiobolus coronatus (strain ATCC 28846 / CBS 209.66 / NRRL 28638) TaxID=796925 RepID=A0A137P012_CONC2|nr:hypothetical protein CONCODRAFT_9394 [Conidiobolus coronatus NRRL 28638]|eukprot:KXN68357.1 hypothetical protein CONCODRAFT_9394 [Conidiobolus coronatus NRRL 28638]